ncbi:MAG TPA: aminotransferase class III-fold pyridoxal phosphate-dependent enzyme, partial [Rhodanobacteraceae bacterium]
YWRNAGVTTKSTFVSLAGSYHGETLGALGVTDVAIFRDTYAPLLMQHAKVPAPDASAGNAGPRAREAADAAADALEAHLEAHRDSIAAMIVEPLVQGASGMVMHHPRYLARVREACTRHDVLLIADEIMTGFGRTGTMFAWEQAEAAAPDLMCLSKGITGGYLPLSAVLASDAIYAAFYDDDVTRGFLHSHSYTGNALACRAALAVLDIFEKENVVVGNHQRAQRWRALAQPIAAHANVEHFRTCGMITAFDVKTKRRDFARWCFAEALERELVLRPIGRTVYFMPPYVTTDEEFDHLVRGSLEIVDQA